MERQSVASSLIRSVGYDPIDCILEVEFVEPRRVYAYFDVPYSIYVEWLDAPSKGQYFNEFIRDDFDYEEVREASAPPGAAEEIGPTDPPG